MQKTKELEAIAGIGSSPPYDFSYFRIVCFFFDVYPKSKTRTFIFAADYRRTIKTREDTAPNVGLINEINYFYKGILYKVGVSLILTM